MIIRVFLTILLLFLGTVVKAQDDSKDSLSRISVNDVVVNELRNKNYEGSSGSRISNISKMIIESNKTLSLAELLSENSLVYIKSYGQGALATSSFRGTSSNHTQVSWNGININPSMSGSFDFSQIPVFFVDEVNMLHGSSYSKSGSGALGGSISVNNRPQWDDTVKMRAFVEAGSFATYTAAASYKAMTSRQIHQSRVYYTQSKNNYKYLNKVLQINPFYEYRKESDYKQVGLMQEDYFKVGEGLISSTLWVQASIRSLPQPIVVNKNQHERQKSANIKYLLAYQNVVGNHSFEVKGSYLYDIMDYKLTYDNYPGRGSNNISGKATIKGGYSYSKTDKLTLSSSIMYSNEMVKAGDYSTSKVLRNTASLQGGLIWKPQRKTTISAQVMGEMIDHNFAPTSSLGATYNILESLLTAKASVAYNYHYPTLNDIYWKPGGNINLKPEKGFSYDATLTFTPKIGSCYIKIDATYYIMNITDWIVWLPTNSYFWAPQNLKKVRSHGVELLSEVSMKIGRYQNKININYSYSPSINKKAANTSDNSVNKQLPYIPLNKFNIRYQGQYQQLFFAYSIAYTGKRYTTTDNSYSTNSYIVNDFEVGYNIKTKGKVKLTPKLRVNNLFNAYYESIQYYPMPLRSFSGSLSVMF